jgi:hypothetical protein
MMATVAATQASTARRQWRARQLATRARTGARGACCHAYIPMSGHATGRATGFPWG